VIVLDARVLIGFLDSASRYVANVAGKVLVYISFRSFYWRSGGIPNVRYSSDNFSE
jgi:hypothetical protein